MRRAALILWTAGNAVVYNPAGLGLGVYLLARHHERAGAHNRHNLSTNEREERTMATGISGYEIERDCDDCEGVVTYVFEIYPAEPDVGIRSSYAVFDYLIPCDNGCRAPAPSHLGLTRLEEAAMEEVQGW